MTEPRPPAAHAGPQHRVLAFRAPAAVHARLVSRDFPVILCLRTFERKSKTKDKFKRAKFTVRGAAFIWEETRS